jgi:geranylgeranyl pyrophosphate synthase
MAGVEVAVLLGDYIYAKAFHMAVQLPDPAAARWLAETVRVICQGEITQVLHRFDFAWTEARYFTVIAEKTASLYAAACRLGGHYSIGTENSGGLEGRLARARGVWSRARHRLPDRRRLPRPRRR